VRGPDSLPHRGPSLTSRRGVGLLIGLSCGWGTGVGALLVGSDHQRAGVAVFVAIAAP
jgi:hypothetical protein